MGIGAVHAQVPPGLDLAEVLDGLSDDNVWAPEADVEALQGIVAEAAESGIDLKIVAIPYHPVYGSGLRDLANDIGAADSGTVLALSPWAVGTYSDDVDRFTLERAQHEVVPGDPVAASSTFLDGITEQGFPWTTVTLVLLLSLVVGIAALRWWTRRGYFSQR
ncbi:hypothetical protein HT102_01825 [Hoyosella sp. G463]|uniref:Uncharacterized protein n=1 Tax=Lolliginicoccus lacisalsi TaxID=2742202 RepID=A0A927J9T0_9ACTN|nr:DUF6676 family protein [Lolliginicoccus lacisalsi]MBD8505229.1 hypothetical protein [Lolliginicoccus lacisalsi]